jgi:CRISPR/Cas system-associated endoribonuclease Cas2
MPNYMICYDVRAKNHDYKPLYALLNKMGAAHLQNSVWFASVNGPAEGLRDAIHAVMHNDDTIAVVRLPNDAAVSDWATWIDRQTGVVWLKAHYG